MPSLEHNYAVSAVFRGTPAGSEKKLSVALRSRRKNAGHRNRRQERRLHFQESDELSAVGRRAGTEKYKRRHARVSKVHGNFIVNDGDATAAEVWN